MASFASGAVRPLYTHCGDLPLCGPNDIVFDAHGGFYFTDFGKTRPRDRDIGDRRRAAEAIAGFNRAGIPVAVVTNQAGIARGLYGFDDVALVHKYIAEYLAEHEAHIDLFLFSPYHPDGVVEAYARASDDRKPGPGMAKAAAKALGLDLAASWVVGDRPEDVGLKPDGGDSSREVSVGPADRAPTEDWTASEALHNACFACHAIVKELDFVFNRYAP